MGKDYLSTADGLLVGRTRLRMCSLTCTETRHRHIVVGVVRSEAARLARFFYMHWTQLCRNHVHEEQKIETPYGMLLTD